MKTGTLYLLGPWWRVAVAMMALVLLFSACTEPAPSATATPTVVLPAPTRMPTTTTIPWTPTSLLTPTPTLPPGPDFACIPPDAPREVAQVLRVIDGDTITVFMDKRVFTVRYLGIDTPETKKGTKPAHPWGPPAHRRNRELVGGKTVLLVEDPRSDKVGYYGRLLRYVIVDGIFVNKVLVEEGLARLYPAPHSCEEDFIQAKERAKAAGLGIWSRTTPTPIGRTGTND